jgi:tRNA uridine 5-carboxymethylaminomethyl modification enzyme
MRYGKNLGLIPDWLYTRLVTKEQEIDSALNLIKRVTVSPGQVNSYLESAGSAAISENEIVEKLIRRPEISLKEFITAIVVNSNLKNILKDDDVIEQVEIEAKYEGYIRRQHDQIVDFEKQESIRIPKNFDYDRVHSLSNEGREKLKRIRPDSIGHASRISGVTPSDVSVLMIFMKS